MGGGIRAWRVTSRIAGRVWVGRGATRVGPGGKFLLSKNKLRQYRPPSYKKPLNKWQSNFQWRAKDKGKWKNNYHVDHRRWW
jgi:hypothetical protein